MKKFVAALLCILTLSALAACGQQGETVTVQPVSALAVGGSATLVDRYPGTVVSGQTAKVTRDTNKTVLKVYVQEGDMVEKGTVLFAYDAAAMELSLEKLKLELEGLENTITSATSEIEELERQRAAVAVANQLAYTIQIDSKQADIREAQYNKALKEREITAMETSMAATEVASPISGRVMSITEDNSSSSGGSSGGDSSGSAATSTFITIMDMTSYRVQGNINELNLYSLTVGMPVIIRSRTDENVTWTGSVASIDWENPSTGNNNGNNGVSYGYVSAASTGDDGSTSSSKYPFYIKLDSVEGLILGQHVYVEPDYGQENVKEGIWLPSYYICDADSSPWVWAASSRDKLEKRTVVLGDYDSDLDAWQVTAGLAITDYLAFPDDSLSAGQAVSYYSASASGGDATVSGGDAVIPEGGTYASGGDAYVSEGSAATAEGEAATGESGIATPEGEATPSDNGGAAAEGAVG